MPSTVWSKLQDVAMRAPVVVPPQTPLRVAAEVMDKESIGAVVVAVDNRTVGILSERDVVSALAWGADPDEVTVAAAMSHVDTSSEPRLERIMSEIRSHRRRLAVEAA